MQLLEPNGALLVEAKRWHQNEDVNLGIGLGSSETGAFKAAVQLEKLLTNPPPNTALIGAFDGARPVGYIVFYNIDDDNRTGRLALVTNPDVRGIGRELLTQALDKAFDVGLHRVEFCPTIQNRVAINMARKVGFRTETIMKDSLWQNNHPWNQVLMRVTKTEWNEGDNQ